MSDLKFDQVLNDLTITNGDLSLIQLDDAIRQNLFLRLRLFYGEWFLDTSQGVPYFQRILVKNPNLDEIQLLLKNVILSTNGVTELETFQFGYDSVTRALKVSFAAKSTNGTIINISTQIGGV